MVEFTIKGGPNYLKLSIDTVYGFPERTCHWGGYECTLHIDLKIEGLSVKEYFSSSTGEIFDFYQKLKQGQKTLKGSVNFKSFEENREFRLDYDLNGNVVISGTFDRRSYNNRLVFMFESDQTYLNNTLVELHKIIQEYGGHKGIKDLN